MRWFVQAPCPRTMPTILPKCVQRPHTLLLVVGLSVRFTGQSRTCRSDGRRRPRCRQRRIHQVDRQHSRRQGLGVSCQPRTPARNTCMGKSKCHRPASRVQPVTSPKQGSRSERVQCTTVRLFFSLGFLHVVFIDVDRSCDSRKYTYFFPSYLLIPPKPDSVSVHSGGPSSDSPQHPFWDFPGADSSKPEEDLARKRQWRVSAKDVDTLRATAKKFEGTHNFHNFTVGRDFADRSNQRHMIKIQVRLLPDTTSFRLDSTILGQIADPAVYGDTEWISVLFHGQSFMLHQVGLPVCPPRRVFKPTLRS